MTGSATNGLTAQEIERLADIVMFLQRGLVQHLSQELSHGQISFPQFFLLGHISSGGPLSMSTIAEKMSHTTAAATGLVDRLEKLGYVQRTHDVRDRRKVLVKITEKGKSLVGMIRQGFVTRLTHLTGILAPEEQAAWLKIYEKINDHISCSKNSIS